MIQLLSISRSFASPAGKVCAVKQVDLSIEKGEIVCLLGRSGSGKTTLLNLIGTLDKPDSGDILYNGLNLKHISSSGMPLFRRKNIGFVFQYFNLVPYLSALENIALPLKYDGLPKKERLERASELLEMVGLTDRKDFLPSQLSGGQVQRVAFARAVVNMPEIVLADEPTGQLDSITAEELVDLILSLNSKYGVSFFIATHDQIVSEKAHKTLYMKDGSLSGGKKENSLN
ncbi:MAG: ABC transporter ATP-binding protein [Firmicutes bacterium]|nr:ABC transporter ATP-binding protein [Bacillota bacterium]